MRILYVSYFWNSLKDIFCKDGDINKGMPGFIKPLECMIGKGWIVDFIFVTADSEDEDNLKSNSYQGLISKDSVLSVVSFKKRNRVFKLFEYCILQKKIYEVTLSALELKHYDFVYCQSEFAFSASLAAKKKNIPCGQRQYGTFLFDYSQQHSMLRSFFAYPLEVLSYNTKKDFLLVTDDGTKGDVVYQKFAIRKDKFRFCFWLNGVDRISDLDNEEIEEFIRKEDIHFPAGLYLARVTNWKRQDRAIYIVSLLKQRGFRMHLYIVGQYSVDENGWYNYLQSLAKDYGITDQIHFLGALSRRENAILAKKCDVSFVMYDYSCLGNVFHELLSDGALLICQDDANSLENYLINGINGFTVNDSPDAVTIIEKIINGEVDCISIRKNAEKSSEEHMKTWNDRIDDEIHLIEDAIAMNAIGIIE